ncbi:MAG: hypothetical protein RR140_00810 [Clostridia bacterium]
MSLLLIFFVILPFNFKIKFSYNFQENLGVFCFSFLKLKLKLFLFTFKKNTLIIKTKKHKKVIEFEVSQSQIKFIKQLSIQLKDKIKIKDLVAISHIGLGEAMESAILSGFINQLMCGLLAYVKNFKKSANMVIRSHTSFNKVKTEISAMCNFSISIFDILYSILMSFAITKRTDKY